MFEGRKSSQRSFFNYIDRCTKPKEQIHTLQVHGEDITDNKGKANALSNQYQSVFTVDNGVYPHCTAMMPPNSFCSVSITDDNVLYALNEMNPNSAPGDDGMYVTYLRNLRCFMVEPLKLIFQQSLDTGELPHDWKRGLIIPIYKKNGKPGDPGSYRPICLTSVVCKLLEKIVHMKMVDYLGQNNLLSINQHGFMKGRSTASNLVETLDEWTSMIDDRIPVDCIYIDLAKAFDSVSHAKLLYKLESFGFGGQSLAWLRSFLCGRCQSVVVGNARSEFKPVISVIPQGTLLGPLMLILFINDIDKHVDHSTIKLFADDTKLYRHVSTSEECSLLRHDLKHIENYFSEWQLNINADKCEVLHLGFRNRRESYSVSGIRNPDKPTCKDLGITIGENLTFTKHMDTVTRNAYFRIRQCNLRFASRDRDFRVFMYVTYLRPLLEYNTQIWSPHYIQDIEKVEQVQRRFTKFLPGMRNYGYVERLGILNLSSLEERRIFQDLVLFYEMVREALETGTETFFTFANNNLRGHRFKVREMGSNLNCRKYFFINRTAQIWNKLDPHVAEAESLNSFKHRLRSVHLKEYCRGRTIMA